MALRTRLLSLAAALLVFGLGAPLAHAQVVRPLAVVTGLDNPLAFVQDPSLPNVQFIVEKTGLIRVFQDGVLGGNFLSLVGQVSSSQEQGLLGLAFAPDYASSGRFYVNFTNLAGDTVVARFRRSLVNPLLADPASRKDLVWPGGLPYIDQPAANHNGGNLVFGPDGYLYIAMGDGGPGNDPNHMAQTPGTLLGKMLRIDVDVLDGDVEGYDVPGDNPFIGMAGVLPEIWAFGLRNPWRYSFDDPARGGTGALIVADVGQSDFEEINYEPMGVGGRNYGWRNRQGAHPYIGTLPPAYTPLTDPIHEYGRTEGQSVTGGFVYRGSNLGSAYQGRYFVADFFGRLWSLGLTIDGSGEATVNSVTDHTPNLNSATFFSSFGVDASGELYLVSLLGTIYKLVLELVPDGNFTSGMGGWQTFATPDPTYFVGGVASGVFEFYRVPPPPGTTNQAVVFRQTGLAVGAGVRFAAQFDLGNSSSVRKRMSVLIHDSNFNDVAVCTFWLPAGAPLRTYRMWTHTIEAWSNATISFYAATAGSDGGFYRLDNVSLAPDSEVSDERTDCVDPLAPTPPGGVPSLDLITNGSFSAGLAPWGIFGQIFWQIAAEVFEFYRPAGTPAGVVLQQTGAPVTANGILTATFQIGNSSATRARVTVLLHNADFSDLTACTFWVPAGQALSTYTMRGYATQAWTNATLSVYPSTIGTAEWMRLDNVMLQRTPGQAVLGTECVEPPGSGLPPLDIR